MIGQTLGHYRILEKVAAGGMGVVYRARDEQLDRDVALKVLPSGTLSDDTARRRFRKEAMALAKLNHPNIETVYEFGTQDGMDFLVMEYVPGKTLADRLTGGTLPEKEVVALGMQIAAALEEAHERGIVHRDLKPANIAITAKGRAKILDFGLAKLLRPVEEGTTEASTDSQAAAGTLPYMPPEQLKGEPVDARADIYTIGAVLYEMATDRRAFREVQTSRLIDAILHQPPVPPRALNPRLSTELETIILKCLDKEPERRYQSATELLVDLRRLSPPSSTYALPPPPSPVWSRVAKLIGYGVSGLLVFAVGLAAMNVGGWRERLLGRLRPPQIRSIAVLPLANLSGDPLEDYFADGVTEALITELAQIGGLRVISRTSIMVYKGAKKPLPQIARELQVDAVVDGSVQRSGDKVRINAELIEASADRHLWAKSYERDLRDILTLQSAVAKAIADEIQIKLTPQEQARLAKSRQVNPEALEAYLAGRFYWNKRTAEGLEKSIAYFQRAIAKDPNYALAYAGLADSYHVLPELSAVPVEEAFPKARSAALKALEIDDSLGEAHSALANIKEDYDWDWKGAEKEYKKAIELSPGHVLAHASYSNLLFELGRLPEALSEARVAQQLDPLSAIANDNLSAVLYYAGQYDQAVEQCRKTLDIDPLSPQAHRHLGQIYVQKQFYGEAVSELKKAMELSRGSTEALAELGYVFGVSGKKEDARHVLVELKSATDASAYRLAIVYAGLSEKQKALEALKEAVNRRSPGVVHLKVSPVFQELRSDERFQELLIYMGLTDRARGGEP
jgi:serine/threonine protein kinase/tetratricopeptide (TPR) repeat protein